MKNAAPVGVAFYVKDIIFSFIYYCRCLFCGAAGSNVAALVVRLLGGAYCDAFGVAGVNEVERAACGVNVGDDTHMTNSLAYGSSVEEYQIAWLEIFALNFLSIVDL